MTARRKILAAAMAATLTTWSAGIGPASADTSPGPAVPTPTGDVPIHCPAEQYPAGGTPRDSASVPYEIPFTATLGQKDPAGRPIGGYLEIANGPVTAVLGGPVLPDPLTGQTYGSIFASACGTVTLPSESGSIPGNPYGYAPDSQYNNNFAFNNPTSVSLSLTGFAGLPPIAGGLNAYVTDDGSMSAQILPQPAPNGGLQVQFDASAKSTSDLGPAFANLAQEIGGSSLLQTIPAPLQGALSQVRNLLSQASNSGGNSCTITIGNEVEDGTPPSDVTTVTKLPAAMASAPVQFTTQSSGKLSGRPVTGPVTASNATLVANDFAVGAVDPLTTPAPQFQAMTHTKPVCSSNSASLLDQLLGLPSIPNPAKGFYPNSFYAPGTFAVYTSS